MTDGIRRTNIGVNPSIDTNTNQVENDAKVEVNSTNQPALGYSNVRDSYEVTKSVINQNTAPSSSETPPKIDASASNLLDQQMLSAKLGNPLFKSSKTNAQTESANDAPPLKQSLTFKPISNQTERIATPKQDSSKISMGSEQIRQTEEKIEKERDAAFVQFATSVVSAAVTVTGAASGGAAASGAAISQSRTSELFESQDFKPIIDDAARFAQHQESMETQRKANEARARINELEDGLKADSQKLDKLEQQLAEAKAAYAENPTEELAKLIEMLSKEIDEVEHDIKEKKAEIQKQQDLLKELRTGEAPEQNTQQARDIS